MAWYNVWSGLKNKTCRYLLQRYLGQFLEEKLNLEQLKVDLFNGKATIRNVSLKVEALNELFEAQGWNLEAIDGHIGLLTVTVPWNALMTSDSSIEVADVFLTLRPVVRQNDGTSMLESMWSSVSSSMQLAEECMKQNDDGLDDMSEPNTSSIAGLEKFAETIDNVLNRIQATFTNVIIKLECPSRDNSQGIALYIEISNFTYKNETGCEKYLKKVQSDDFPRAEDEDMRQSNVTDAYENIYLMPMFAKHNIMLSGLRVCTREYTTRLENTEDERANCFSDIGSRRIPILEIKDQQKIQIKMKQSENITGPKVSLDAEIGAVFTFLTPRQTFLLIQFCKAFQEDQLCRNSFAERKNTKKEDHDCGILLKPGNWSNCDENLTPKNVPKNFHTAEFDNKSTIYCESVSSSSSTITSASKLHRKLPSAEFSGEIFNFTIRITAVVAVILHEDVLVESSTSEMSNPLNEKSQDDLVHMASNFFASAESMFKEDIKIVSSTMKNNLCVCTSPLFAEGVQQRNKNVLTSNTKIVATSFKLYEILDGVISSLLIFDRTENVCDGNPKRPDLVINTKSTSSSKFKEAINTFELFLEPCTLELDVSIYDRLSCLFGPSPFVHFAKTLTYAKNNFLQQERSLNALINVNITCALLGVKIRFPIVDVRPIHDPNRAPWWKKNVRDDFLFMTFNQLYGKYDALALEIEANEIAIFYCENDIEVKKLLMKTYLLRSKASDSSELLFEYPKITVKIPSHQSLCTLLKKYCDAHDSGAFGGYENGNHCGLPFSSKRVCRESDTLHNKRDTAESETIILPGDTEEIKQFCDISTKTSSVQLKICLPIVEVMIESKHVYEVIYNRLNTDLFMWEPSSPILRHASKQENQAGQNLDSLGLMDSIYVTTNPVHSVYNHQEGDLNIKEEFQTSQNKYEDKAKRSFLSDSENSEESSYYDNSTGVDSIYMSIHDTDQTKASIKQPTLRLNASSIDIVIGNAFLVFYVPVRDSENRILPEQYGTFDLKIKDLRIFSVNGYNSDNNLAYLCLQLSDIEMYHCGILPGGLPTTNENFNSDFELFMQSTLYKTPNGLTKGNGAGITERETASLVIEIKKIPEQRIKRLKITAGLQQLTLRYHPSLSEHFWLNQLIDFLDVIDFPIEGYEPFGVITEIQLHLWDCAIDYRPKNIGFRTVIEIGSFTIGSNIISAVSGCNLRLIVEEGVLSVAPFDNSGDDSSNHKITFLESTSLVPVLDVGLLDISLRLTETTSDKCPKFDLRCSVHDAHLRTCSDSGTALAQLISYVANDGDFSFEENTLSTESSANSAAEIFSTKVNNSSTNISEQQQERVNSLMAEAVQETVTSDDICSSSFKDSVQLDRGIEVFYFPDESNKTRSDVIFESNVMANELTEILNFESNVMKASSRETDNEDALPQIKADLGDIKKVQINEEQQFVLQEEDFCLIADDEKHYMSDCGIKNMEISNEPLRIVDNHFHLPLNKPDLLKPPESFPMAVTRYTLCEMTFTWHLYGGNDFLNPMCSSNKTKNKTPNSRMSDAYKHGVSHSKGSRNIQNGKKPKELLTWKSEGGPQRNHEILVEIQFTKVRLSHEVYPTNTSQASRQVLMISEIEIRDRLQTSDINKFLYYPNMRRVCSGSSQHVVVIKALHVRPNLHRSTAQECSLRISLLPMRLHIDQDTLIFLVDYFTNIGDNNSGSSCTETDTKSEKATFDAQAPIVTVPELSEMQDIRARNIVSTNIDLLMEKELSELPHPMPDVKHIKEDATPIFFREVVFSPDVQILFDYHGRRVELSKGPIAGLLMGLGQLQCSEIRLRNLTYRRGLLGMEKLLSYLFKEWLKDIKKNQLPKILSGVGPAYAFVQFFQGIYDLFRMPIEQYQKDGRILRGLQLGAQSFTARTALAALEITSRIIQILQFTAETAFDMVSPGPPIRRIKKIRKSRKKRPRDIREGVTNAYLIFKEGINDSANTLIETAVAEHDQKGYTGAVGAVIRHIPPIICQPAVWTTQATTNILGGVKNSLVPDAKLEAREKWKDEHD